MCKYVLQYRPLSIIFIDFGTPKSAAKHIKESLTDWPTTKGNALVHSWTKLLKLQHTSQKVLASPHQDLITELLLKKKKTWLEEKRIKRRNNKQAVKTSK